MSEVGESSSAAARQAEFKKRLRQLHDRRFEARKANRAEVVEEDRREKLPPNFEQKLARKQWQIDDLERRKDFEERGEDYERARMLETQADSADKVSAAKRRKQNPDSGFTTYDAMTLRQYQSQTKQMKPDMKNYAVEKADKGSAFYPTVNTLLQGSHYPSRDNITKMTEDLEKTIEKRGKFSRRRTFDPDAPSDFINERNRKYNAKLERFYGEYTKDIRQNIERGTAV